MSNFVKSPLNYVGGKYKVLDKIIPLFPDKINTFVDMFGGGGNVSLNVNADHIVYNDIEPHVVDLMKWFKSENTEDVVGKIESLINKYELSKTNRQGFLDIREYYNNEDNNAEVFYTMICYAFNYQIRFNNDGKYNMPFGKDRSSFNPSLKTKLIEFVNKMHEIDIAFINKSFEQIDLSDFNSDDLVYCDPPYFNSVASYNENGGWTEQHEQSLHNILDNLNERGINFAFSNNFKYNNPLLREWSNKYKVHYLGSHYANCNYHKKDKTEDLEVLITNY